MIRRTDRKTADQEKIAADLAAFKAKGGKIEELPGFGQTPTLFNVKQKAFGVTGTGRLERQK